MRPPCFMMIDAAAPADEPHDCVLYIYGSVTFDTVALNEKVRSA